MDKKGNEILTDLYTHSPIIQSNIDMLVDNVIKSNNHYPKFSSDLEKIYKKIISKSEGYEYLITPTKTYLFVVAKIAINIIYNLEKENAKLKNHNKSILEKLKKELNYTDLGAGLIIL